MTTFLKPDYHAESALLLKAREAFLPREDVLRVRIGYQFENGWITPRRALVIVVRMRKEPEVLAQEHISMLPSTFLGYPVEVSGPTLADLLETDTRLATLSMEFKLLQTEAGRYFPPPGAKLEKIRAKMRVQAAVSPESGWRTVQPFFEKTKKTLTVGIYDLGAPHVVQSLLELADNAGFQQLTMAIQPGSNVGEGTKKDDLDDAGTIQKLSRSLDTRFRNAWVRVGRTNGWVASSYHIKLAVRDRQAIFLSSGNWQSSNLPDVNALDNPTQEFLLNTYNRDWHIVLDSEDIAATYEQFLLHDYDQNKGTTPAHLSAPDLNNLYFLVPATELATAWQRIVEPVAFKPFEASRTFTVTPLISPDNYFEEVLALVQSAETELYIQNQTFNAPSENQDKLRQLVGAVLDKQRQGVDVKIIFRNFIASVARENLEALVDLGFQPDNIKMHDKCHTKGIIVDRQKVLVGSQNWSGDGVSVNRDASMLFEDEELAGYFRSIFLHDWEELARQQIGSERMNLRVTTQQDIVPAGMKKIAWPELLELL